MTAKTINFPNQSDFFKFTEELRAAHRKGKITDFVCMVRVESDEIGESARIGYKWFGDDSTLYLRGMLRRLDDMMKDHMDSSNDQISLL